MTNPDDEDRIDHFAWDADYLRSVIVPATPKPAPPSAPEPKPLEPPPPKR